MALKHLRHSHGSISQNKRPHTTEFAAQLRRETRRKDWYSKSLAKTLAEQGLIARIPEALVHIINA